MDSLVTWAWGSCSRDFYLPQIKADGRECHKCKKLQRCTLVLGKGLMLSPGLELRRGVGMRIMQRYRSWAGDQTSAAPCSALWTRGSVLWKLQGSVAIPGLLPGDLSCTEAGTQASCYVCSVCGEQRWLLMSSNFFPSLHSNLSSCSWIWNSADLPYLHAQNGVRGYSYVGHLWFGHKDDTAWNNSPRLQVLLQTVGSSREIHLERSRACGSVV